MKIIHYSFHIGCINDAAYIFTTLGHDIVFRHLSFPNFCVTDEAARDFWKTHEAEFQVYDIILTTDTVALSYIFLNQIDRLKPHLLIWNCNRFDYAMWNNPRFYELVRMTNEYHHKVTYIPWTDYELLWCGKHGVHVSENTISSVGKILKDKMYVTERVTTDFGGQRREYTTAADADSVFVQKYLNHSNFIDLPRFLHSKGVSTVWGGYTRFEEIQPFKGVVVLPDSFCKMFAFESIQNEVLVFLPTKRFLLELVKQPKYWYNVTGFIQGTNQLTGDYINLCEWYKYPETRVYFDSLDDMVTKIRGVTAEVLADKKRWMKFYGAQIEALSLTGWRGILDKVQVYKEQKLTSYYEQYPELAAFKKFRKVIVWGYPLGSHTHSYIHGAWVKALTCLGLPVSWYHDGDFPATEDFSNCCFITEGWADKQIPVVASSTYFVHIAPNPAKYLEKGARLIEIRHNVERINDYNYLYTLPTDAEALSPDTLYRVEPNDAAVAAKRGRPVTNVPYEAVYMYWATDLLPHEIDYADASAPHEKVLYHIGTLDGGHPLKNMKPVAEAAGVAFVHKNPWEKPLSYEENIRLMKASYCCPDYRNYVGIDSERKGYIPCRVFKAISYGQSGITNSERTKALLGDHVEYVSSLTEIFSVTERRKEDVRWRQAAMKHVAERHTYIHRLRDLARALAKDPQTQKQQKKNVVVIAEKGWSIDSVHKGVASALSSEYSFQYHDARHVFMDRFLADVRAADICLTSMNFYFDMMNIFSADHDRRKIAIIAHGISDMWGMPAKGDVCTSFTYGVTSEVLVAPMSERLGVPLYVTPNGVDPSDYSYRERNGVVTTVGWCGSEALEIKRVSWAKEIAASVGLELRVAATVPREEMAAWYNSIDLLLVTSGPDVTAESGPLPPFEAIVSGVPVIGVPCGNFSFLPGPKFSTVEEGVALIRSLIASPDQVKSLADEQRDCVLRRWTYNAVANQWRSLFEITTSKHKDSRMIAVTMYGGFRSFELNLRRNIEEVLGEVKGPVHFYILTEHCADYDAKKQAVVDIIQSYGYEIKYFEHVGESSHYKKEEEDAMYADYYAIPYNGIRDDFTPKLFYRRCLINKIMNSVGIPYDKVVCARMFDIIVKRFKSLSFINDPTDATLYYSVDTIIIGRMKDLNTMFAMNKISDIIQIPETDQGRFWAFYDRNDRCLASIKPKLASETIYQSILFKHFLERSVNLRYDFTRHDTDVWAANNRSKDAAIICDLATNYVKDDYLFVLLDPNRR